MTEIYRRSVDKLSNRKKGCKKAKAYHKREDWKRDRGDKGCRSRQFTV